MRQWREEDLLPFAEMNADPRVMEYFPSLMTREQSDELAQRCGALIAERGWGMWALETREEGKFIGFLGLHTPGYPLPFNPCVESGWRLGFESWGKGYASEAAQAALHVGFTALALEEIVSFTTLSNLRSQAVMKRIGMTTHSADNFNHPVFEGEHPLREHCLYRLKRDEWAAAQTP